MENLTLKKFSKVLLSLLLVTSVLFGCSKQASTGSKAVDISDKKFVIGIGQFAEHPSLDNCRKGIVQGLAEEGFREGENVTFRYDNAQTDGSFANQIYTNYISSNVDMLVAIATPMAQTAYSLAKETNIPIIYSAITDPVAANLANDDLTPIGNITGTSDRLPVDAQLALIKEMFPDIKKLGILYTNSEVNSLSSIDEYKYNATKYDIDIVSMGINETSDIPLALDTLLPKVDALTNVTDNTVVASLPIMIEKANAAKKPVFGSEVEQVKLGCIACMGLDYVELGKQTGKMAAKILRKEVAANKLNYEIIENASLYINTSAASVLNYTISDEIKNRATEIFN